MTQGGFEFYTVMERGIAFKPNVPQQVWLDAVEKICAMFEGAEMTKQRALMMLADAMNYGEAEYGEMYSQAINGLRSALGLTPKTIANAQWVYKKIHPYQRRDELTLAHYSLIAAFDPNEQEVFIAKALEDPQHTLTVKELKEAVIEAHPKTSKGKTRKAVIDLKSEEGLHHAMEKVGEWLTEQAKDKVMLKAKWKAVLFPAYQAYRRIVDKGRKR